MRTIAYPLAVDGILTRVIEAGQGPAVLFVHGLGARADRFAGTVERIAAAGYRAIACDLPGHGFAQKGAGCPADVPALAAFITAVLDRLEVTEAVLAGTSLGAHIAGYAAAKNPGRFSKLCLIGALGIVPLAAETAATIRRNVKASSREQIYAKLKYVIADPAMLTDELVEEEWRINNSPGALASFTAMGDYLVDGIAGDYVAEALRAAYAPADLLLVWGAEDHVVPVSVGEACREALGGAELFLVPGAGHAPYAEQPAVFDARLLDFLRRT
jgi:pimeloyl-ACP methyl ester carboxylesterase